MSQPAARKGDKHFCPMIDGNKPHTGGNIENGIDKVIINGRPAATVGSACRCKSPSPNSVAGGSAKVIIDKKPAARVGDRTTHGGSIEEGSDKVLFG